MPAFVEVVILPVALHACFLLQSAYLPAVIDPLVAPILKDRPGVGLVVGVLIDGKTQVFGYGKATTPCGEVTPDGTTLFEIGSITKVFTGVLLADAVARKEVKLDDPANAHLPPDLQLKAKGDTTVTLLHLATHRSGFPVEPPFIGAFAKNSANPYADFTRDRLAKLTASLPPTWPAGEKYLYSNVGAGLLGHALVNAAKADSFDALVGERVCRPLGLKDTGEAQTGHQKARLARGHTADGKPTDPWEFATLEACGGLRSTAPDLLAFAAAGLPGSNSPLAKVIASSQERQADTDDAGVGVGLCWHTFDAKARTRTVWHNGGTGGYASMLAVSPASGRAVVVLAAIADRRVDDVAVKVLREIQP